MDQRSRRDLLRLGAALVLLVVLIAFVIDNSHKVTVGFVVTERRVALIWVLAVTAALGAAAGYLLQAAWRRRH